ncbi:hypothetical protein N9174_04770 [bacterium]|nr:hypothetical protein [bacterium]
MFALEMRSWKGFDDVGLGDLSNVGKYQNKRQIEGVSILKVLLKIGPRQAKSV